MVTRPTNAPMAGMPMGGARLRSGTTAPICTWHLGGVQPTQGFQGRKTDVPTAYHRWLLELSP
jgi:hypothetical protein